MLFSSVIVSLFVSAAVARPSGQNAIGGELEHAKERFRVAGITPGVIPVFEPSVVLDVTFHFNDTIKQVDQGTNFTRPQTINEPTFSIGSNDASLRNKKFVVAMVDPDAPTPQTPTSAQIRHFLGGNFQLRSPPSERGVPLFNSTPALSEYRQPTPPNNSSAHRYIFLLFNQPADFPTTLTTPIQNFNITAFAQSIGMGNPIGGNFITVSTNPADGVPPA